MNKFTKFFFAIALMFSIVFISEAISDKSPFSAQAQTSATRKNKGVIRQTYAGGKYVTRKTWNGTKWVSRKVWVGTKYAGKKTGQGAKYVGKKTWKGGRKVVSRTKKIVY